MKRVILITCTLAAALSAGAALGQSGERERAREEAEAARQAAAEVRAEAREQQAELRAKLAEARERMQETARQIAELSRELGERTGEAFVYEFISDEDRGVIGVVLDRDGEDLKIASVSPGSPAEEAGIEAGDVVVAVNGDPVELDRGRHHRTPEGLRGLKVGDEVALTLSGDAGTREVTVEAGRRESFAWAPAVNELRRLQLHAPRAPGMPRFDEDFRHEMREAMKGLHIDFGRGWNRVELSALNEDLGSYFGTDDGVLVVSAPEDNPLGLKGGDVILRIGDRQPNDPGHAFRIVRSYGVGETLEVEILRAGDRETLSLEIEDEEDLDLGWSPFLAPEAYAFEFKAPGKP